MTHLVHWIGHSPPFFCKLSRSFTHRIVSRTSPHPCHLLIPHSRRPRPLPTSPSQFRRSFSAPCPAPRPAPRVAPRWTLRSSSPTRPASPRRARSPPALGGGEAMGWTTESQGHAGRGQKTPRGLCPNHGMCGIYLERL